MAAIMPIFDYDFHETPVVRVVSNRCCEMLPPVILRLADKLFAASELISSCKLLLWSHMLR